MNKILITGAGSGIGLACARKFLKEGWEVYAHFCTNGQDLLKLKKVHGSHLQLLQADFSSRKDMERFLSKIGRDKFQILINNAGVHDFSMESKDRYKSIHQMLDVNVVAPALIARAVIEGMKSARQGSIINISSIAAHYGSDSKRVFYGISKRGLEALTKTLSREGAPYGICVNTIRPGVIDTRFHQKLKRDLKQRVKSIPLGRCGEADEVAHMIFQVSAVNRFMTNQILTISGGE